MFLIGNILLGVAEVLRIVLHIYWWIVLISVVLSWVYQYRFRYPVLIFLKSVTLPLTEPVYRKIRRYIPITGGGFDLSPIVESKNYLNLIKKLLLLSNLTIIIRVLLVRINSKRS